MSLNKIHSVDHGIPEVFQHVQDDVNFSVHEGHYFESYKLHHLF
jgi:hypothetical protein